METFLIRALQLVMSLSLLVIVHEGGHFLFARLFKVRVEKFCLFFDPWFALFKFKPKKSETQYVIGWLPLGGYVKIAGMIDESMDTEQMKQPAQPWEFRSKPTGQRLLIMIGGVLFNFLLALFIYSMILFHWGEEYVKVQEVPLGMEFSQTAQNVGFRNGDILFSADGVELERYDLRKIMDAAEVTVIRDNEKVVVPIPEDLMQRMMANEEKYFADFRIPYVVDSVLVDHPASQAGIRKGDNIVAINGKPTPAYDDFLNEMEALREQAKASPEDQSLRNLTLAFRRDGVLDTAAVVADPAFIIGVFVNTNVRTYLPVQKVTYGFFESFPAGVVLGVNTLKGYIGDMRHVFSKEGAKQLGGFATIGSIFPASWDWHRFWLMTAFLSIILAFMNILPIPALDGGHVLFLIYEIVARRKPNDKFMEYAQITGMIVLFGLLIWANFNDVMRFLL